jgi:hypothetical protein
MVPWRVLARKDDGPEEEKAQLWNKLQNAINELSVTSIAAMHIVESRVGPDNLVRIPMVVRMYSSGVQTRQFALAFALQRTC